MENLWPQVLRYLMKREGIESQGDLVDLTGISRTGASRALRGEFRVQKIFGQIAKGFGLTENELAYVYAWHQLQYYKPYAFDLESEGDSEVREPAAVYDRPSASRRAEALARHDLRDIPPELTPAISLMRDEVKAAIDSHRAAVVESESHLARLAERLERVIVAAEDLWRKIQSSDR